MFPFKNPLDLYVCVNLDEFLCTVCREQPMGARKEDPLDWGSWVFVSCHVGVGNRIAESPLQPPSVVFNNFLLLQKIKAQIEKEKMQEAGNTSDLQVECCHV